MPGAWETHMWVRDPITLKWNPWDGAGGAASNIAINAFDAQSNKSLPIAGCYGPQQFGSNYTKLQVALTDNNHNPLGYGNKPLYIKDSVAVNYDFRAEPTGSIINDRVLILDNNTNSSYTYLLNAGSGYLAELSTLVISNTSETDAWVKLFVGISNGKEIQRFFAPKKDTRCYCGSTALVFTYVNEDLVVAAESNVDSLYINCHIRYIGA